MKELSALLIQLGRAERMSFGTCRGKDKWLRFGRSRLLLYSSTCVLVFMTGFTNVFVLMQVVSWRPLCQELNGLGNLVWKNSTWKGSARRVLGWLAEESFTWSPIHGIGGTEGDHGGFEFLCWRPMCLSKHHYSRFSRTERGAPRSTQN